MPFYTYECKACRELVDELRKIAERNEPAECQRCGGEMQPQIGPTPGFVKNPAVPRSKK